MADDDFVELSSVPNDLQPVDSLSELQPVEGVDYLDVRDRLLEKYRAKKDFLLQKIASNPGSAGVESIVSAVIEELLQESENLLGNEILLMTTGQVDKASVISVKRSDILNTLSQVAVRKKDVLVSSQDVDLNSPVFQAFQEICFEKLSSALDELQIDTEMRQIIAMRWSELMADWGKELRERMKEMV